MASEMTVTFPGGKKVDTQVGRHVIRTDQPAAGGGEDSAPAPFGLFLAAIGTCAGIYVVGFCQKRDLPTEGIRIRQRNHFDPETGVLSKVELDVWRGDTETDNTVELLPFDDAYWLIKRERMPDGRTKLILKSRQTGEVVQRLE